MDRGRAVPGLTGDPMRVKLAFCLFRYFPYSGLARDFLRVLQECRSRGHELHVYVSEWQGERPDGVTVNELNVLPLANHTQNTSFYNQFKRKISTQHFDAIIGFNKMPGLDMYYGADYCYIARAVSRYGFLYRLTPRFYNFCSFERAVFDVRSPTTILSLSEREKGVYQQHYGTPDHRFQMLPPTLDINRKLDNEPETIRSKKRRELLIGEHECLLLFIGSGFKTKGLDRAIRAMASLPGALLRNTRLLVVGQDNDTGFLRLVARSGLAERVRFIGGRDDIMEIMSAGDLLIHPAYNENTGTVLIEAIAAGLPVLATDVCGFAPHITYADAGIVLKSPFVQKELDEKLKYALTAGDRFKWHQNGIEYGKNPGLYRMPETVGDLIEQRISEKRHEADQGQIIAADDVHFYIRRDLEGAFSGETSFDQIMQVAGQEVRKAPGRKTIRFKTNNKAYYLKTHTGVGWQEILKNIVYFRAPVLGAMNEWHGIHHLNRLGINTLTAAGYGSLGGNPATRRSFILTDEIADTISLETLCHDWMKNPPRRPDEIRFKHWLIQRMGQIARDMHNSGANHRDFYLCHFLLKRGYTGGRMDTEKSELYIIDLHRMQIRKRTPSRWAVKDIAGLYFSSRDAGLTSRDLFRFMQVYRSGSLREVLTSDVVFWYRVRHRGDSMYKSEKRRTQGRKEKLQPAPDLISR